MTMTATLQPVQLTASPEVIRAYGELTDPSERSLLLSGHATSVALEPEFWAVLEDLAHSRGLSLAGLLASIKAVANARIVSLEFLEFMLLSWALQNSRLSGTGLEFIRFSIDGWFSAAGASFTHASRFAALLPTNR